jgi:tetratricopeptide (TPR) repeat protein
MARADRRSAQRAKQTPGIRASGAASSIEQTLFFSRIRKRAKWVFVFLALSFAIGFVVFGVGTSGGGGIGDILQGRSSSPGGGPSVESAQKKVAAHPKDATALRELATALENEGRSDEALPILERYTRVQPKDDAALSELAGLYLTRAGRLRNEAQQAQLNAQLAAPGTDLLPPTTTPLGRELGDLAVSNALLSQAQRELNDKLTTMEQAYRQAQQVYERIVVLRPDDAAAQLDLGNAAVSAGDTTVALAAYRRYLELAPDDPQAPLVRQQIKRVQASLNPSSGG